ncbi:unnamed protein product, partial [Rotaria socialis]
ASGFAMHYPKPAGAPSNVYAAV